MSGSSMLRLEAGGARLDLDVERGGRIASWSVDGRELLIGPPTPNDRSIRWGLFLMAPWAGRLADGRFMDGTGRTATVPRTHGRHAIHGLLWNRRWTVDQVGPDAATLSSVLPGGLWPPGGMVRHEVRLGAERLDLRATLTAGEGQPMPAALGWHPWFARDGDESLRVDAAEVLETDRMIPTGRRLPVGGRTDLRRGARLGRRRLDHAYLDARPPAILRWPDAELVIDWSPTPSTLVVYTPAHGLCVEPQTAWPNAPALEGTMRDRSGLTVLEPGATLAASMTLTYRRLPRRCGLAEPRAPHRVVAPHDR